MAPRLKRSMANYGKGTGASEQSGDPKKKNRCFQCQFCAKEFFRNEHLQRHERLHTKEKPFQCKLCSAGFARRDLLRRHVALAHPDLSAGGCTTATDSGPLQASYNETANCSGPSMVTLPTCAPSIEATQSNPPLETTTDAGLDPFVFSQGSIHADVDMNTSISTDPPFESYCMPWTQENRDFGDFDDFIDSMGIPYSTSLPALMVDQPLMTFPLAPPFGAPGPPPSPDHLQFQNTSSRPKPSMPLFDQFTSTFPTFNPGSYNKARKDPCHITQADWNHVQANIRPFISFLAPEFRLPSRHTLSRYIAAYVTGFHRHLPFLHIPTFSPTDNPVELTLAVAAVGAQYSFDGEHAVKLFKVSNAIIRERLRRRKSGLQQEPCSRETGAEHQTEEPSRLYSPLRTDLRDSDTGDNIHRLKNALPLAQTLLLLMAMATWGDPAVFCNEPASLQNALAWFVREEKLLQSCNLHIEAWPDWIHAEGLKRTAAIIFCFFNFHTIIYNTSPPILNSELNISLPSREADWEAQTESAWREARKGSVAEPQFRTCFSQLFSNHCDNRSEQYSSLGGYVLILALIQQTFLLRELNKMKPEADRDMSSLDEMDVNNVELALRNWQVQWENNPESSLQPNNSSGPVSFNSTALLRMAYIRLHVDVGPWRALSDQDPQIVAQTIHRSPSLRRSPKLTSTVLYSAHALSIPVKLGVNTVAHNQAFTWSLQHSLCALECAFVISKWLDTLGSVSSSTSLDDDELRLLAYITDMVEEADCQSEQWRVEEPLRSPIELCSHVIRIWSRILNGETIWPVVHMVGQTLNAYYHILNEQLKTV